jgi:MFS family permease
MRDNPLTILGTLGQSIWLDYIRRDLIASGGLRRLIEQDELRGMTSNPVMQLIDRVGRRPLLLVSLAGMTLSLFVLGLAFSLPQLSGSLGWIAVASLMVYVGSFAVGLGPVFWLILSEIYPLRIRGRAMSVGTVANWSANLIVALSFLTLTQVLGKPATFWLYAVVSIGAWFFAFLLVPETKGRSLEEIEAHWRAGKHPRAL